MEECENLEILLNTFMQYYKKTFPDQKINGFFDNITNYDDTNKLMEYFYQCLNDYNSSRNKMSVDFDSNRVEELEEYYILKVDNVPVKMSDNIISLLIDVINSYENKDWIITDE
jgi:hypothetical protein